MPTVPTLPTLVIDDPRHLLTRLERIVEDLHFIVGDVDENLVPIVVPRSRFSRVRWFTAERYLRLAEALADLRRR